MTILLALLTLISISALIGGGILISVKKAEKEKWAGVDTDSLGTREQTKLAEYKQSTDTMLSLAKKTKNFGLVGTLVSILGIIILNGVFYLEPGHNAHGRTIFGSEFAYVDQGWHFSGWGRHSTWKKYFTVATTNEANVEATSVRPAYRVRMLDQVDGLLSTTVRYRLPEDPEKFKALARAYRTPANLLSTELEPPVKETMNATSSLMGAEEYYNGGRTEFASEFDNMMREGIFQLKRIEELEESIQKNKGSANAAKGTDQDTYGENQKTVFNVIKITDPATGMPIRKAHNFLGWGITVETAIVTDFDPNAEFDQRMKLKQKASADRAIAREQRIQEEEQKLLAEATGKREVAQAQAAELKIQIQQTTQAETEKQLEITKANKLKESAKIAEETATIELRIAKLEAAKIKQLADAEAYKKSELMEADGALDKKLEAYVTAQAAWAQAYAVRKVPQMVMSGGGSSANGGTDGDAATFQAMLNAMLAKDLLVQPNATK